MVQTARTNSPTRRWPDKVACQKARRSSLRHRRDGYFLWRLRRNQGRRTRWSGTAVGCAREVAISWRFSRCASALWTALRERPVAQGNRIKTPAALFDGAVDMVKGVAKDTPDISLVN